MSRKEIEIAGLNDLQQQIVDLATFPNLTEYLRVTHLRDLFKLMSTNPALVEIAQNPDHQYFYPYLGNSLTDGAALFGYRLLEDSPKHPDVYYVVKMNEAGKYRARGLGLILRQFVGKKLTDGEVCFRPITDHYPKSIFELVNGFGLTNAADLSEEFSNSLFAITSLIEDD